MTVEYVLILVAALGFGMKFMINAPSKAFRDSAPRLAMRVEKNLITGDGFDKVANGKGINWKESP